MPTLVDARVGFALFAGGASESIKLATQRVQLSLFLSMKVYNNQKI